MIHAIIEIRPHALRETCASRTVVFLNSASGCITYL